MLPYLLTTTDPEHYAAYLRQKLSAAQEAFAAAGIELPAIAVFPSAPRRCRMRSEFGIVHRGSGFDYAMFAPAAQPRRMIITNSLDLHTAAIDRLMPALQSVITGYPALCQGLFEVEFLANQAGQVIAALRYHKKLQPDCAAALRQARTTLHAAGFSAELCAQARGQLLTAERAELTETYALPDARLQVRQVIGTFSQPNAGICTCMLEFVRSYARSLGDGAADLLELYCGCGTFTVALAPLYRRVLATEVCRNAVRAAHCSLLANAITNAAIIRLSATEICQALSGCRDFRRLREQHVSLADYHFATVLIDPPRQGLRDEQILRFVSGFAHIIYVSCSTDTLLADLSCLCRSHTIVKAAFFDQFPYTQHLESIVILTAR